MLGNYGSDEPAPRIWAGVYGVLTLLVLLAAGLGLAFAARQPRWTRVTHRAGCRPNAGVEQGSLGGARASGPARRRPARVAEQDRRGAGSWGGAGKASSAGRASRDSPGTSTLGLTTAAWGACAGAGVAAGTGEARHRSGASEHGKAQGKAQPQGREGEGSGEAQRHP